MLVLGLFLAGCSTSQDMSRRDMYTYRMNSYAQTASFRQSPIRYIGGPLDNSSNRGLQTAVSPCSTTSRSQVGSTFSKRLAAMKEKQVAAQQAAQARARLQAQKDRERRITEFLWENEIPGVSDTRVLLKNTIAEADRKLKNLADDLRLAGQEPGSDSIYVAILHKRNRLQSNLKTLDDKIMSAIVSKSAGSAAGVVSFSAQESCEMAMARANLQSVATQYRSDTEQIIRSSDW